jgi:hypothetical protein
MYHNRCHRRWLRRVRHRLITVLLRMMKPDVVYSFEDRYECCLLYDLQKIHLDTFFWIDRIRCTNGSRTWPITMTSHGDTRTILSYWNQLLLSQNTWIHGPDRNGFYFMAHQNMGYDDNAIECLRSLRNAYLGQDAAPHFSIEYKTIHISRFTSHSRYIRRFFRVLPPWIH